MTHRRLLYMYLLAVAISWAGSIISSRAAALVTFEAESGTLGADWAITSGTPTFITITSYYAGNYPSNVARVATYNITFPTNGLYQLYARVLVGPAGYNSDSLFYGNGFGTKNPVSASDWVLVNGLAGVGFSNSTDVVTGGGTLGDGMWKWINLSQFTSQPGFTVNAGSLTQTLQIGARETGLEIDKFAFGTAGTSFTVSNLDTGTVPLVVVLTNYFPGPDGIALHRFNPLTNSLNFDGANPAAGLVLLGNVLWGTTLNGGVQGAGTAYNLSLDGTSFNVFRPFTNAPDAGGPQGGLVVAGNNLIGTTVAGGSQGTGTVFLTGTNGNLSIVRNFAVVSADEATNSGGASPNAVLALSGTTLYGTTTAGGAGANGTIFSIATNGTGFTGLHDFSAPDPNTDTNADGALPGGGVIIGGGTLYGTALAGGAGGVGVIFSINAGGGALTVLHAFTPVDTLTATNSDGAFPNGGLILSNGVLYGTTLSGGTGGGGVIFAVGTDGSNFSVLHNFSGAGPQSGTNADGAAPCASLTLYSNVLYGTASGGGINAAGTVFSVGTNGAFQMVYAFPAVDPVAGTNRYGAFPASGVLPVGTMLYGTASGGGPGGEGTVFALALPLPPALITNVLWNVNGSVTLDFLGSANSTNVIQAATGLASPAWQNISTNTASTFGTWQFTDTNTWQYPARYYRSFSF
jgi:uncharacterized repeat protein (TIGR03803 family)